MALYDIKQNRFEKGERLKSAKINPYPLCARRTHLSQDANAHFDALMASQGEVILAGRLMSLREHGGSAFAHIQDGAGRFQIYLKRDILGEKFYNDFFDFFDIGDIVQARGVLFKTKKGEKTLEVRDIQILTKALLPLPEKWHGLKDIEERFRKRYLDILMNEDVRRIFEVRSKIIKATREFLDKNGFLEVETSILQPIPGGASARPFKTHLNALDMDLYLRVAPELDLKKLLVGGFEKVYEIGRSFRNEGMDYAHNPEFTSLEFYWAYTDYKELMKFSEELFAHVFKSINVYPELVHESKSIDLAPPWPRVEFTALFQKYLDIDYTALNRDALSKKGEELGIKAEGHLSKGQVADQIYKKAIRSKIKNPTFIIHHPAELAPLAKPLPDNPSYDARFQLVIDGWEVVNAFSELNDPVLQRQFFEEQEKQRKRGDEEAQHLDDSFLEALEYGLPPAAGFAFGVDRLTALLTNSHSLREVILFPTMRPKKNDG